MAVKLLGDMCCNSYMALPTVYNDSLSYLEDVCKLAKKVNEVVEYVNSFETDYKTYTDEQIAIVNKRIDTIQLTIAGIIQQVDQKIGENQKWVKNYVTQNVGDLTKYVNDQLLYLTGVINNNNNQMKIWVKNELELFIATFPDLHTVYVNSPVTGVLVDIQTALNELWDNLRYEALTAAQYDSLLMTADYYDGLKMTANVYDIYGKRELYQDPANMMFNPETGAWVNQRVVIEMLVNIHKLADGAYQATEYDALDKTASVYDGLNVTAYNYDWKAKTYITA